MNDSQNRWFAPVGLVVGAVFGMAGTFVPSASMRGLFWGIDGIALIVAAVAGEIFIGRLVNPLSEPLPVFAYPFFAATLLGWARVHSSRRA